VLCAKARPLEFAIFIVADMNLCAKLCFNPPHYLGSKAYAIFKGLSPSLNHGPKTPPVLAAKVGRNKFPRR